MFIFISGLGGTATSFLTLLGNLDEGNRSFSILSNFEGTSAGVENT